MNPRGRLFFPALVPLLVKRFGFLKFPQSIADFDETKGVEFAEGYMTDVTIDKIVVWRDGIQIDTRSSTTVSQELLEQTLIWLGQEADITYERGMIKRWAYLSQILFYSDANFDNLHPSLNKLCANVTKEVSSIRGSNFDFHFTGVSVGFDRWNRPAPVASFLLQRRAESPFSENKYFSEAPLPTDTHIRCLEQFESDFLGQQKMYGLGQ